MAIAIKSIPVLTEQSAKRFSTLASRNLAKKNTIDFTKQSKTASLILKKSKLK
jgi:hypothetical protein